jgi:hypothetical protein
MTVKIFLIRFLHGMITIFFIGCLAYIYYAGITDKPDPIAYGACFLIAIEGLVVTINKGNCPLGYIHKNAGDDKTFFELFLPKPIAQKAVPFLGLVAIIGFLLLLF